MAHACNPTYSGGRDQEDCSSKPVQANSLRETLSQKYPSQKKWGEGSGVAQGVSPEFKPQYHEKERMMKMS
jgi:hypothetical protein